MRLPWSPRNLPIEANGLRRAMATFRNVGTIHHFQDMMVERMVERGYERDFAQRCFDQIKGFGSYGFPESHAASFAKLVYISSYLKCHHPAAFACALLNSQPMGFYAPAQIVREAQENGGVEPRDRRQSQRLGQCAGAHPLPGRKGRFVIPPALIRRETRGPFSERVRQVLRNGSRISAEFILPRRSDPRAASSG
jgi:hypothetical protein